MVEFPKLDYKMMGLRSLPWATALVAFRPHEPALLYNYAKLCQGLDWMQLSHECVERGIMHDEEI